MSTEAALTLSQWLSPAYPLGSFAYSHGLEAAIAEGWVRDATSLERWLTDVLCDGSGHADAVLLCAAFKAQTLDDLADIDAVGRAFAASNERLRESLNQGIAFARTTSDISRAAVPPLLFPIGFGWASAQRAFPLSLTASLYLHAFISNIVMACLRLMRLGQTSAQTIITNLTSACETVAAEAQTASLEDLYSNTFMSDIAAMRHETQQPRLFQS